MGQEPTEEQLEIINHKDGHLLVLAGPGSGKTYTVVERVQKLASYDDIDESEILCITFTDKATGEMSNRLEELGNTKTKVSTFHAFCKEICTENSVKSGLTTESKLVTEELMKLWAIRNSDSFGLDEKIINFAKDAASGNSGIFGGINSAITNFKQSVITSAELQSWLEKQREEIGKMSDLEKLTKGNMELIDYVDLHFEFNKVYAAYEKFLRTNSRFDFSDLIRMAIDLFKNHPAILESYKKKYKYILVDEFQDNNFSQYEIVRLLGQGGNVMVVGDDDQLIMRFQGAREKNFEAFQTEFADVTVKKLTKNFRSTKQIVGFANLFTDQILGRQPKQNTSDRNGDKVKIVRPTSGKAQIEYVVKTIRDLLGKEYINKDGDKAVYDYGDFAILSRQRKYGRDFVDELKTYDIPTTFRGDYNMFESPVIAEVLQYIHIIQSPSTAGMWLHKIMTVSGIDDINIRIIGLEANSRKWNNQREGIDETFEVMKDCESLDISQKEEIKEIVKKIEDAIKEDAKGTVAETVYKIIYTDLSGVYKRCSIHDDRLGILMLNKFYESTLDFENLWPERTIQEFDEHLKFMRQVQIDLEDSSILDDTVQVMTMHTSKGKEYPVVFLTDITTGRFPGRDVTREFFVKDGITENSVSLNFSASTKEFDDKRLLYVSSTRAENQLHVLSPKKYDEKANNEKKVSKYLDQIKYDAEDETTGKLIHDEILEISTYNATTQNRQGPATVHERIKTEVQGQMFNSINKMQISTALYRLVELARIKYYEEHKEEDPECTGFDVQEFLKVEEKDLNFKDLHGRAKPLFDHDSLEISKSGLGTYKTCPYKYKLEKIQRTPTAGSAIALDLGNSVHNTIDALVKEKPGEIPTKEELHAKLEEEWIFQSFPSKATSNATKQRAQTMLENYEGWQKTTKNTVVVTEKEFRFDYEGVTITGRIDWVEKNEKGEFEVVDFKSGMNPPTVNEFNEDPQLYVYARGIQETAELGKLPVKGSLYYFEYVLKSQPYGKWMTVEFDEKSVADFFEKEIKPLIKEILKENFEPKTGDHCSRCPYLSICDAGQNR